ncbi:MAG: GntR family transcriptional regulator [Ancalomicrobiaceae bacterium]|nr:GntR family transcriptional regulator [Ancalomicrobiaceae bacterium]
MSEAERNDGDQPAGSEPPVRASAPDALSGLEDVPLNDRAAPGDRARQIHDGILAAILEHRLHPGTKLGEDEIGTIYGVSRTIVRSALQSLTHEGIVVIEKNRGAFVARPSMTEAVEVFEARKLIEATIARRAAERCDAEGLHDLKDHVLRERQAAARGDDHTAIRLSGEFHLAIARIADHRTYADFLRELVARSSLIILLYRRQKAQVCGTDDHVDLAEAIGRGDAERASSLMLHHLDEIETGLDLVVAAQPALPLASILKGH